MTRRLATVLAAAFTITGAALGCTSADRPTARPTTSPPSVAPAPATTIAGRPTDAAVGSPPPPATTATTATAAVASIPVDPTAGRALCATLTSSRFFARRAAYAAAAPDVRSLAVDECPDAVAWLDRSSELADAAAAFWSTVGSAWEVESVRFVDCRSDGATVQVANPLGVAVAAYGAVSGHPDSSSRLAGQRPFTISSIAPQSRGHTEVATDPGAWDWGCEGVARIYVLPEGTTDGSTPGAVAQGPQTSDDPAVFVPAIVGAGEVAASTRDPDDVAAVIDLHSVYLHAVVSWWRDGLVPDALSVPDVVVCGLAAEPAPGIRMVALSYLHAALDDGPGLVRVRGYGMFRKGADGAWRWLGQPVAAAPDEGEPC